MAYLAWLALAALFASTGANNIAKLHDRTRAYCAWPLKGALHEAQPPTDDVAWTLRHVTLLGRHGDRSALHSSRFPLLSRPTPFLCGEPSADVFAWAASRVHPFCASPACAAAGGGAECEVPCAEGLLPDPDRALEAWGRVVQADGACGEEGGTLTTRGWRQLRELGGEMGRAYSSLLGSNVSGTTPVRLVSTDTGRTALSALAFAHGLLGDVPVQGSGAAPPLSAVVGPLSRLWGGAPPRPVPSLPQLHLPLPLFIVPRAVDPLLVTRLLASCPRARTLQSAEESSFRPSLLAESAAGIALARLTGIPAVHLPTAEEAADITFAGLCHGHGLPCFDVPGAAEEEEKACLTLDEAVEVLTAGDRLYATRFSSDSTRLTSYPMLAGIARGMRDILNGRPLAARLSFNSAHDTVLAPLLQALGVLRRVDHAWPGYGSRVAFELWTGQEGDAAVRLLFNGNDWTDRLECAQRVHVRADGRASKPGVCSLEAFEAVVEELQGAGLGRGVTFPSWTEACAAG
jgi:hypothetical protein